MLNMLKNKKYLCILLLLIFSIFMNRNRISYAETLTEMPAEEMNVAPLTEKSKEDEKPITQTDSNPKEDSTRVLPEKNIQTDNALTKEKLEKKTSNALKANSVPLAERTDEISRTEITVSDFTELENAINSKDTQPLKIVIAKTIDMIKSLSIQKGKDILLTSNAAPLTPIFSEPIEKPQKNDSLEKKKEFVEKARVAGKKALELTDLTKNPIVKPDIILQRAEGFFGPMFVVEKDSKLTIGKDATDAIFIDGKGRTTKSTFDGMFFSVSGELNLQGGVITGALNESAYTAPVKIEEKGVFNMTGGRITGNTVRFSYQTPTNAGAVYVNEGATFNFINGSIDNNTGAVGGVFVGTLQPNYVNGQVAFRSAVMNMEGGIIAKNYGLFLGNGLWIYRNAQMNLKDGIIAGNRGSSPTNGGAIAVIDNYVTGFDGHSFSTTYPITYDEYVKLNKSELNMTGGLLYANKGFNGGGIYMSSDYTHLKEGYLLDNSATNMGGAVYVSIVPYTLTLQDALISENHAKASSTIYHWMGGNGGGLWNCPVGKVTFEDFHSGYFFNNTAALHGDDIYFHERNLTYRLNNVKVGQNFYTTVSVVTKDGNLINYLTNGEYPERIRETDDMVAIKSHYTNEITQEAWKNSTIFMMGNDAQKGGGIASNANLHFPGNPGNYKLTIKKVWDERTNPKDIPENIRVDILIGDIKYGEVILNAKNDWSVTLNNLPFSKEELELKGLKYEIKEEKFEKFKSVVKEEYTPQKETGKLSVERVFSDYSDKDNKYDDPIGASTVLNVVEKDEKGKFVRVIGRIPLNEMTDWKGSLIDDFLKSENIEVKKHLYYGRDEKPYDSWDNIPGFNNYLPEYDLYLVKHEDGKYTAEIPYLWIVGYDENAGFQIRSLEDVVKEAEHQFVITNHPYVNIPVEKTWDENISPENIPETIRVYLLNNGKRVMDEKGAFVFLDLLKENGWKGEFKNITPISLTEGEVHYSVEEDLKGFKLDVEKNQGDSFDLLIRRVFRPQSYPTVFDQYGERFNITVNVFLNDTLYKTGEIFMDFGKSSDHVVVNNIPLNGNKKPLKIEYVLKDNGKPYAMDLESYDVNIVGNETDGYTVRVPKLTILGSFINILQAEVTDHREEISLRLHNSKIETYPLVLKKVDRKTGEALAGVTFGLFDPQKEQIATGTTNAEGLVTFQDLEKGTYFYRELEGLANYHVDSNYYEIQVDENTTQGVMVVYNDKIVYPLILKKVDRKTGEALAGVTFGLFDPQKEQIAQGTTNAEGLVTFTDLEKGTYYYRELEGLKDYQMDSNYYEIQVDETTTQGVKVVYNDKIVYPLVLKKVDRKTGEALAGVTFGLFDPQKEQIARGTTNAEGLVIFQNLEKGTYFYRELEGFKDYHVDSNYYEIQVDENTAQGAIMVYNDKIVYPLILKKVDRKTGEALADVTFGLFDPQKEQIATGTTNAEGLVTFTDLEKGTYFYRELEGLKDYQMDSNYYEIQVDENTAQGVKVVFNDKIVYPLVLKKVDRKTGEALAGVTFGLFDPQKEQIATGVTNQDGLVTFTDLEKGTYFYRELEGLANYHVDSNLYEIQVDETTTQGVIMVYNDKIVYPLVLKKVDRKTGEALAGVTFGLFDPQKEQIATGVTNQDGLVTFTDLEKGTYFYRELEGLANYHVDSNYYEIQVDENTAQGVMVVYNDKIVYPLVLKKVDRKTGKALPGVTFGLFDPQKEQIAQGTTNAEGLVTFTDLEKGTYFYRELEGLANYHADSNLYEIQVDENTAQGVMVVYNDKIVYPLILKKVDRKTGEALAGVTFGLFDPQKEQIATGTTNAEGLVTFQNLEKGTYYYRELEGLKDYHVDSNYYEIQVDENTAQGVKVVYNDKIVYPLVLKKLDRKTGEALAGVTFGLFDPQKEQIATGITNQDGLVTFTDLEKGTYFYREIEGLKDYHVDSNLYEIQVDETTTQGVMVVYNDKIVYPLILKKVDRKTGEALAGVTFGLFDPQEEQIARGTTNADGLVTFTDLEKGTYFYRELEGLANYHVDSNYYEIQVDETTTQGVMVVYNDKIVYPLILKKVDRKTGEALAGVTFGLFDQQKEQIARGTTNAEGLVTFTDLEKGTYFYREIEGLANYHVDSNYYEIQVDENTAQGAIMVYNDKIVYPLVLKKVDRKTGEALAGVTFGLFDPQKEQIARGTTNAEGLVTFTDLEKGTYYYKELEGLANYQVDHTLYPVVVGDSKEDLFIIVTNQKLEIPEPPKPEEPEEEEPEKPEEPVNPDKEENQKSVQDQKSHKKLPQTGVVMRFDGVILGVFSIFCGMLLRRKR